MQDMQVGCGNRVWIKHARLLAGRLRPALALDTTVDHDMRDMNALRAELARHALRQTAQGKLAHRERCRERVTFYARRGSGEQDRAAAIWQHAPGGFLRDEEAP